MADEPKDFVDESSPAPQLKFDYIKSNSFRTIHCDGVYGGLTPAGLINMAIYSERFAIPERVVFEVMPDGSLGDEVVQRRIQKDVVREVEANVVIDVDGARGLIEWLQDKIDSALALQTARAFRSEPS